MKCRAFLVLIVLSGCDLFATAMPKSEAEIQSGYTYVPLDPLPVSVHSAGCRGNGREAGVLESLPDNAARVSVAEVNHSGELSFVAGVLAEKGGVYRVTIDYINSATAQVPLWIKKTMVAVDGKGIGSVEKVDLRANVDSRYVAGSQIYEVRISDLGDEDYRRVDIPVYVGIGLRVISQVTAFKGKVNIAGLGAIGAGVEADALAGTLVVQTLGVNGKAVAAAIPIHSELNRTTVQASIVSVSAIKAMLHGPDVSIQPRVVGMYLPIPADSKLVNAIVSALSGSGDSLVGLERPCISDAGTPAGPVLVPSPNLIIFPGISSDGGVMDAPSAPREGGSTTAPVSPQIQRQRTR